MNHYSANVSFAFSHARALAAFLGAILLCSPAPGRAYPAQEALPDAGQVLDWYVEATGGMAAYDKINNRVMKTSLEIRGAGITLSSTVYLAKPNKSYSVTESPATGKIENGSDGESAWNISDTAGPQLLSGSEKSSTLHMNTFDRVAYWKKSFKEVKTAALEDCAGKPCYRIVATPEGMAPQDLFFDKESHLLVKIAMTMEAQAGKIPVTAFMSDYKPVGGILVPHTVIMKLIGQERISRVLSVEQNVDLPADRFAPPPEIKALIK